jgi:hypothetical protein
MGRSASKPTWTGGRDTGKNDAAPVSLWRALLGRDAHPFREPSCLPARRNAHLSEDATTRCARGALPFFNGGRYRGQALMKMLRNKPPSTAMSERCEQAKFAFEGCLKTSTLPATKRPQVGHSRRVRRVRGQARRMGPDLQGPDFVNLTVQTTTSFLRHQT